MLKEPQCTGKNVKIQKFQCQAEERNQMLLSGMEKLRGFVEKVLGKSETGACLCSMGPVLV